MSEIKHVSVFRTISSITVFVYDGYKVIDEYEVSHKSDNAYGKIRDYVNMCKDKWIVKISDEDGIL